MKNSLLKEILLIAIAITPLAYLGLNYAAMPEIVPTHFDGEGVANGFSPKSKLWFFTGLLAAISYGLMLVLPKLDPKKNFEKYIINVLQFLLQNCKNLYVKSKILLNLTLRSLRLCVKKNKMPKAFLNLNCKTAPFYI